MGASKFKLINAKVTTSMAIKLLGTAEVTLARKYISSWVIAISAAMV